MSQIVSPTANARAGSTAPACMAATNTSGAGFDSLDIVGGGLGVDGVVRVEQAEDRGEFISGTRRRQHHGHTVDVKVAQEVPRGGEGPDVVEEFPVPASPGRAGLGAVAAQQLGHELVAAHSDQAVDGVHRGPFAHIPKGPRPGQGVKVVGVDQRSVHIEEDARPEIGHAGRSFWRFWAAWSTPVG